MPERKASSLAKGVRVGLEARGRAGAELLLEGDAQGPVRSTASLLPPNLLFFFFFRTFFFFTPESIFPPSPPLPSFGKLEGRMNYCHLLMAEVHCSMEILLVNSCGDEAEPTTPFCAFYKEGKGGMDVPVFTHRSVGVWAFHTLISMRIPCGGCQVKTWALTK